jgi:hypothetical protein
MLFVLPLSLRSNRLSSRSTLLLGIAFLIALGVGLLSFVDGLVLWLTVIVVGSVRDSFMSIFFTRVNETRGVDNINSATAIGFTLSLLGIGSLIFPPLGNSLATESMPYAPLIFWAFMAFAGGVCILWVYRQERVLREANQVSIEEL